MPVAWEQDETRKHWGWTITAIEEDDEKAWVTIDPAPIGICVPQDFVTFEDAIAYIERRESEKFFYRMKY